MSATLPEMVTEDSTFLQRRVALFGLVGASLGSLGLVLSIVQSATEPGPVLVPSHGIHLIAVVDLFAMWQLARGAPRSPRFLRTLEATATLGCAFCFHLMAMRFPPISRPDLIAALIVTQLVITRAIVIPSTGRTTALISTLVAAPLFLVAYNVYRDFQASSLGVTRGLPDLEVTALTWGVLAVLSSTLTSRVIYGLRREVRSARELGQYTLLQKLGEGGMGQVFRARHAMLRRPTAVKLLHSSSPDELARFEREVQLTARLTHPNTVTVFDYGRTPEGVFYYAMELLDGADLQKIVEHHGPMPVGRVVHLLAQVAAALTEAHAVGLIHRDIKPANIILCVRGTTNDVAKVVDFGLVKSLSPALDDGEVSNPDIAMGTPLYMAPETLHDGTADVRTDIYSLGAVAYFLLTASPVFPAESVAAIAAAHLRSKPVAPSARLGAPLPADLEALVMECLAKAPGERPQDATTLRERLLACKDVPPWSEEDARRWWSMSSVKHQLLNEPVSSTAKTIAVDLDHRAAPSAPPRTS